MVYLEWEDSHKLVQLMPFYSTERLQIFASYGKINKCIMLKQDYYNDFFEIGKQKINFRFFELALPYDNLVYTLKSLKILWSDRLLNISGNACWSML